MSDLTHPRLSGYCGPGDLPHEAAHKVCQMLQDKPQDPIRPCECRWHGGHTRRDEGV